jgi:hypothetical protein
MKLAASKRISRLEIKSADAIRGLADEAREKKARALEEWREKNHQRLTWDLFALIETGKLENPENYKKDLIESEFIKSDLAYFSMIERVLSHGIDSDGSLNTDGMSAEERAFAVCLEKLFDRTDNEAGELLRIGVFEQAIALGIGLAVYDGEMFIADAVAMIDAHRGGPEWRQIRATNAEQEELDSRFGIPTIAEIPKPGLPWIDPGLWYRQKKAGT